MMKKEEVTFSIFSLELSLGYEKAMKAQIVCS
jgi:hypothetical protein